MRAAVLKALYDLHSWCGVGLGLVLYVVCASGVVALFDDALDPWVRGDGGAPPADIAAGIAAGLDRAVERAGGPFFTVLLPTPHRPTFLVPGAGDRGDALHLDAAGAPLPPRREGPNGLMTRLHTDLLLPQPAGRYVVGGLGVLMLVLVVSGVLLHRKALAELFTLRLDRSRRLFWSDLHKSLGLWGLPFHATLALTGAVLGFSGVAVMAAAASAFGGDAAAAVAAMATAAPQPAGVPAPMLPASVLLERAVAAVPGFVPEVLVAHHYGDAGAVLEVLGNRDGGLVYYLSVGVEVATGTVTGVTDWSREGFGRRLYAMVTPLHYATYGGLGVKALYAVLGAGTCALILAGLGGHGARPGVSASGVLARATVAVVHGLPLACAALFWVHAAAAGQGPAPTAPFLGLWAAAALWPALRPPAAAATGLLGLTGGLLLTLPLVEALAFGAAAFRGPAAVGAGVVLVALGGALAGAAWRRRVRRPAAR